jgi:serine protease Do
MVRPARALPFAAILLLAGCAMPATQQARAQALPGARAQPVLGTAPFSFAPLVRKVVPSVVNIAVTEQLAAGQMPVPPELRGTPFERQFRKLQRARPEQVMGAGSGFVIDPSGIIVTNNHVVGQANSVVVSLSDGEQFPAHLIGVDDLTDIAVIKVDAPHPLPAVSWGTSKNVQVGDWVLAAGNPFGLGSSVTAGIVSARGRDLGAGPFDDFLQLDAPINPGNSGGPTFNMQGQVIAVNTAIVSPTGGSVGIGFAIPSEIAEPIVAKLRAHGRIDRGWLGVSVEDTGGTEAGGPGAGGNGPPAHAAGVAIAGVDGRGPAAHSGLRVGDVISAVNGEHVDTARGLIRAVAEAPPGSTVGLTVLRHGATVHMRVRVGRRPAEQAG